MLALRTIKQTLPRFGRAAFATAPIEAPAGSYLSVPDVEDRVLQAMKRIPPCPVDVTLEQNFAGDLKFDTLLRKDLNEQLALEFCVHIPGNVSDGFVNGVSVVNYISKHAKAR